MSLRLYRPQRTRAELLESVSVGREPLVREVLERLARWRPGASRQHYLFVGPRGIGKTHLLRLIDDRVRSDSELQGKWLPILLAEEQYGVSRVSDLLLEMVRRLGEEHGMAAFEEVYEEARFDDDDKRVCDRCLDAFRRFYRDTHRGVLLMMENLDRLLEQQVRPRSEIHRLRKILIEEDWLVTLCTSPTFLNAVSQPEEPFFEFFDVRPLAELTADEQLEMLRKVAAAEGSPEVIADVEKYRSRLRALHHFTGGSPRLTVMLYDLVARRQIGAVHNELDLLHDRLTPFYQDRMKEISEQEAKVLEVMALLPEGTTPSELAREARMDAKLVRATLTRLERGGYVRREERRKKRTVYIVPERLFRLWHQMNHSRVVRGRVQYLLEFFSSWYATREERDQIWEDLVSAFEGGIRESDDDVDDIAEYMEYVAAVSEGNERLERSFERLRAMVRAGRTDLIETELQHLDSELGEEKGYFIYKGKLLADELGRHKDALHAFQRAAKRNRDDLVAQFNCAVALEKAGFYAEADNAFRQTLALIVPSSDPDDPSQSREVLLQLLHESADPQVGEISSGLLGRQGILPSANLIAALRSAEEPWRRGAVATLLGRLGDRAAVEPLIWALKDTSSNVCGRAATALGFLGDCAAVQPLIRALEDTSSNVSGRAATALGHLGDRSAVQPLIRALEDSASNVRGSAATALGRLGDRAAVEPVIRALEDKASNVRGSAATALGRLGNRAAVQPLIRALEDIASNVRGSAATALGRLGDRAAVQPLIHALEDTASNVCGPVVAALGRFVESLSYRELDRIVRILIELSDQSRIAQRYSLKLLPTLLKAALRSGEPDATLGTIRMLSDALSARGVATPYDVAGEFLSSNRDPAVLERQQPEIREAVLLLVGDRSGQHERDPKMHGLPTAR